MKTAKKLGKLIQEFEKEIKQLKEEKEREKKEKERKEKENEDNFRIMDLNLLIYMQRTNNLERKK